MSQDLHRLLYQSRGCFPEDPDAPAAIVRSILKSSRARNEAVNVTGALMLFDGRYGQVLEGSKESVSTTFDRIRDDERHNQISVLAFEPISERRFAQWSMGYVGSQSLAARQIDATFDLSITSAADLFAILEILAEDHA